MMPSRRLTSTSRHLPTLAADRSSVLPATVTRAVFGVLPVLVTFEVMSYCFHVHVVAFDFHREFWPAAHRVLQGLSPYNRSWMNISAGAAFPYPALTALAFVPLALLNHALADWVFTGVNVVAALVTLRVLNVRDWRLYGLALMLPPVIIACQSGNLTLVLGLGIACLWRKRDNPLVAGVLVAVMISLKPFVWPLGLWLLATRRYRTAVYGLACGLALNVVSWAVIGFNQLHIYSQLVSAVNHVMDRRGYSIMSLVIQLGGDRGSAYLLGLAAAAAVGVACLVVGRRGDAKSALALSVAVCLLGTPVLWSHYFALLIVPLALFRPRLDRLWLMPIALWACPASGPATWQIVLALVTSVIVFGWLLQRPRAPVATEQGAIATSAVPELTVAT
jgi:alpha-1,2-mannosyltransferase